MKKLFEFGKGIPCCLAIKQYKKHTFVLENYGSLENNIKHACVPLTSTNNTERICQ